MKWLDLWALCQTLMQSSLGGPSATLEAVHYFTALAHHLEHRKPDVVARHRTYISALEATGVRVHRGRFRKKHRVHSLSRARTNLALFRRWWWRLPVPGVSVSVKTFEEKETDVAIACKLFEILHHGHADSIVLITGDTDIVPAIKMTATLFPTVSMAAAFPFERANKQLAKIVSQSVNISAQNYHRHQLPDPLVLPDGSELSKPDLWKRLHV